MRFAIVLKANMIELTRYQGGSEHTCQGRCRSLPLSSSERLCTGEHSRQSLDLHVEKEARNKRLRCMHLPCTKVHAHRDNNNKLIFREIQSRTQARQTVSEERGRRNHNKQSDQQHLGVENVFRAPSYRHSS